MTAPYGILSPDLDELSKPPIPVIDINLLGTTYCIKVFLHFLQKKEKNDTESNVKGRIVVTSSEAGLYALPLDPLYCASKHGVSDLCSRSYQ
jgi:15-hydroxyprostaglandin dehydrogenase (NAD)